MSNPYIDALADRIKYDVDRLASYQRLAQIMPAEPDADLVRITTQPLDGRQRIITLVREPVTLKWLTSAPSLAPSPLRWTEVQARYLHEHKVLKIELAHFDRTLDLVDPDDLEI